MLKDLFAFFIPPKDDTPENVRRWRIAIGIGVLSLWGLMLIAGGLGQPFGMYGFAYANDVKEIQRRLLERDLLDTRTRQCTAGTSESRRFSTEKLQGVIADMNHLGVPVRLPSCDEVR